MLFTILQFHWHQKRVSASVSLGLTKKKPAGEKILLYYHQHNKTINAAHNMKPSLVPRNHFNQWTKRIYLISEWQTEKVSSIWICFLQKTKSASPPRSVVTVSLYKYVPFCNMSRTWLFFDTWKTRLPRSTPHPKQQRVKRQLLILVGPETQAIARSCLAIANVT